MQIPDREQNDNRISGIAERGWSNSRKNRQGFYFIPAKNQMASLLPPPLSHPLLGYLAALLAQCGLFTALRFTIDQFPDLHYPIIFPLALTILIAGGWGIAPAIFGTLWSAVLLVIYPVSDNRVLTLSSLSDIASLLLYIAVGSTLSWAIGRLIRSRLQAEAASDQIETIFEAISDGIVIYDRDGKPFHLNPAAREIISLDDNSTFLTLPMAERMAILQMRDEQGNLLPPQQWPQARLLRGEVLKQASTMNVSAHTVDGRILHLSISGSPIRDEKGQIHGAVGVIRDETARRTLERRTYEALQALLRMAEELIDSSDGDWQKVEAQKDRSAQRLAELIRSILGCKRVSITMIDPETNRMTSNAVVGLSPEHEQLWKARQPGYSLAEQFTDSDIQQRLQANEIVTVDWRLVMQENRPNPYGVTTLLLVPMNIGGHLIGVLALDHGGQAHVFTQDEKQLAQAVAKMAALVLEREKLFYERAEAQASELSLRKTNRLMDDFIGIAGHELRTPLTTVKAGVQLVQRNLQRLTQARQANYTRDELAQRLHSTRMLLERVESQANIQNRLIHDLLDFSRIQKNRLELHLSPLNMVQLVQASVENQRLLEPERVIHLDLGGAQDAMVNGDADRLGQVITNMLSNALKYSETDKPVEVSVSVQASDVCIRVRDYGPGIPNEMQERIWERFYRVPGIETKSGSGIGLGLGLHISRTLIELHGGKIGLESTVGEGTTFWFTLPLIA